MGSNHSLSCRKKSASPWQSALRSAEDRTETQHSYCHSKPKKGSLYHASRFCLSSVSPLFRSSEGEYNWWLRTVVPHIESCEPQYNGKRHCLFIQEQTGSAAPAEYVQLPWTCSRKAFIMRSSYTYAQTPLLIQVASIINKEFRSQITHYRHQHKDQAPLCVLRRWKPSPQDINGI